MSGESDSAVYQARLVEIFQSCDSGNKGYLSVLEFERLCRQLHLQPQKQRLYKDLGLNKTSANSKVYFEDFKSVLLSLLQEVGPETLTSDEQQHRIHTDTDDSEWTVKWRHGHEAKKWLPDDSDLRLDLPPDMTDDDDANFDFTMDELQEAKSSSPSPLKRAFEEGNDETGHVPKQRKSSPNHVETFEAEGQLTASPAPGDPGLESDSGLEQLRDVCSRLGVGHQGYLTQKELGQVCQFIGMEQMDDEELGELFSKLDVDHDGFISFGEFVDELSRHTAATPRGFEASTRSPALRPHSGRKARTPLPPSQHDRRSPAVYSTGDCISLFSSLQSSSGSGFAKGEEVVDFWERMNVPHGADVLVSLGFDPQSKIKLTELSFALSSEWAGQIAETNTLAHAITATYQQELMFLRSWLDQTCEERNKLRSDLADALSRNSLMAAEVDERHAQLEKSHETRIKSLEQEYQDQLRHCQNELEKEQEAQSSQSAVLRQTSEQLQELHQQVDALKDRLAQAESEASSAQKELSQAREKHSEVETDYNKLKKEMEQQQQQQQAEVESPRALSWEREKLIVMEKAERYSAENKELKDRNDELVAQLEELQQQTSVIQRQSSTGSQGRSNNVSRIPVRTRASSISSADLSEWDDDDLLSSTDTLFDTQHNQPTAEEETDKAPSLSSELKQQMRQKRGERRERERKEIEHGFRVEIAELEDRLEADKEQLFQNMEKEKMKLWEEYQSQVAQQLAEQQKELQNAFAMEKQDLLEQYESRINLTQIQHQEELQALENRLRAEMQQQQRQQKTDPIQDIAANLHARNKVQELEQAKSELEKQLQDLRTHYEIELQNVSKKYDDDIAELKASVEDRVLADRMKVFDQGVSGLEGKLKEDFESLVEQRLHEASSTADKIDNEEELHAAFEQDKLEMAQHYETQILALQEELGTLRHDFETERAAFQQLQTGDLAQSIRQELQEEMGEQVDELRQSWEEERRELAVQNQLLEEELADIKGLLMQERQRSAEAHSLKETVRRLRGEKKETQCLAESLKEKLARTHQQQDLERANYERQIDKLEKDKEQSLRLQALQHAGMFPSSATKEEDLQKEVLEQVIEEVEAMQPESPVESSMDQGNLDQLQGQITQLHLQLQEARSAQFEFQQLKEECELLRQTNNNLEEMVRVLRQRADKEHSEREREEQDQLHELWEEKKKLQNLLQRTTDKLLKTSTEMAAGQTQLVHEVERLKQKAGNMVELETFTGLQVSLLDTQRHAISLQEALMQRTQLADRIMAETDKERRQERESWEEQKREMQSRLDTATEMYRSLVMQHKALRVSTTKLATQMKDLYVENADLMNVLQQTEAKQIAAQRQNRKLQRQCQAWHDAVHRMLHKKQKHDVPGW